MNRQLFVITALLCGICGPASAQSWPVLPPEPPTEEEILDRRLQVLCPQLTSARAKIVEVKDQNDWFDRLVLDRITGVYTVGEGLTVVDQTTAMGSATVLNQQDNEAWAVTYTVPLSLFRAKRSVDAHADRDYDVLVATQKMALLTEVETFRGLLLDLKQARWLFKSTCSTYDEDDATCIGYFFTAWKSYQSIMSRLDDVAAKDCRVPPDLTGAAMIQVNTMREAGF